MHGEVVRLQAHVLRVAREADRVEEDADGAILRPRGAAVDRQVPRRRPGNVVLEVRASPDDGEAEAGRARRERALEAGQDVLELPACLAKRLRARRGGHPRRHDLVVERRDDDLDAVVLHDLDPPEDVLLRADRMSLRRAAPLGRPREAVDELVDAGAEGSRGAHERLAAGQAHGARA